MRNRLLQLFKDNVQAKREYSIKNEGDEATIYLYDAIGSWYGIDAQQFVKDLQAITASTIHLRINSPGGDVFDARAIKTALEQHKAKVIAHIDGLAASAATFIALGADEVEISQGAFFMIHNAWILTMGNAIELRDTADLLDKTDASIIRDYMNKSGQSETDVKEWMAAETWFNADEAVEKGFADRVFEGAKAENRFNLAAYSNAPKALTEKPEDAVQFDRAALERRLNLYEKTA